MMGWRKWLKIAAWTVVVIGHIAAITWVDNHPSWGAVAAVWLWSAGVMGYVCWPRVRRFDDVDASRGWE